MTSDKIYCTFVHGPPPPPPPADRSKPPKKQQQSQSHSQPPLNSYGHVQYVHVLHLLYVSCILYLLLFARSTFSLNECSSERVREREREKVYLKHATYRNESLWVYSIDSSFRIDSCVASALMAWRLFLRVHSFFLWHSFIHFFYEFGSKKTISLRDHHSEQLHSNDIINIVLSVFFTIMSKRITLIS